MCSTISTPSGKDTRNSAFNELFDLVACLESKATGLPLWDRLLETGYDKLCNLAESVLRRHDRENCCTVDDLAHHVAYSLMRRFQKKSQTQPNQSPFGQFNGKVRLAPYLTHTIYIELVRATLRLQARRRQERARLQRMASLGAIPVEKAEVPDRMAAQDELARVIQAINELDDKYRKPLLLYYLPPKVSGNASQATTGLTIRAIARQLGTATSTIWERITQGLKLVQERLGVSPT